MSEGSVLCRLDSKLGDEEIFEVETPNSVMSVRGTIFKMTIYKDENGENEDGEVWFYRYSENENDPNEEPELEYIEDDEEYEAVAEAFDEYLDSVEFDEIIDAEEE